MNRTISLTLKRNAGGKVSTIGVMLIGIKEKGFDFFLRFGETKVFKIEQ